MRLTLPTALFSAGGLGAGVWDGQRCGYRGGSLLSEDNRTAEAVLPLEQGSGRLAGRGLAGVFPQGGSGLRLVGLGCAVAPGAGAGRRTVWKGSVWRLSELGATGSGAVGGAGGSGEGGKAAR